MNVKPEVLFTVEKAVLETEFGSVTLIVQDGRLIQMDKMEKVRFVNDPPKKNTDAKKNKGVPAVRDKIRSSLEGLQYGQVILVIKEGTIVQIERTEKRRIPSLEGVYGEGI